MNPPTMFLVALILLPALGLVTWAWLAMAQVEEDMRSFNGFEAMHFEIGPQAAENFRRRQTAYPRLNTAVPLQQHKETP